jgi:hypothetical protein
MFRHICLQSAYILHRYESQEACLEKIMFGNSGFQILTPSGRVHPPEPLPCLPITKSGSANATRWQALRSASRPILIVCFCCHSCIYSIGSHCSLGFQDCCCSDIPEDMYIIIVLPSICFADLILTLFNTLILYAYCLSVSSVH